MEAENEELSNEILQKTEEFQTRKEELMLERGLLQGEISALEAKLAKLKAKEADFTDTIQEEENKIESVKMEFNPQQKALDKQQQEIERREKSLKEEFSENFDDKTAESCIKEQELSEALSGASDELEKSSRIIKRLEERQQSARGFLNMEHFTFVTDSKLASLHVEHKEVSQQIKNLSNKIQLGQRGVVTLRKTLNEVEAQISDLDAAKEIAKRERNFKEAKRLKEEREALTQEGVESQGKLESLLTELAEEKKLLEKAEKETRGPGSRDKRKGSSCCCGYCGEGNRCDSCATGTNKQNLVSDLCKKHDIPMPDLDQSQVKYESQDIKENMEAAARPLKSTEGEILQEQTKNYEEFAGQIE
ncbi:hypothetical protein OS493_014186 [Desmophyllum pertusum]|uniref:Uncharacterized protein n=1 Tax=Desmophyllum pertusum TaxID=174260 RepID=A0A9W9Z0X1_9CNID|nr:hypothetical protein OS493_014186 [Desmophyllum pertusum]